MQTGIVTVAACLLSAGLVYLGYFLHVLQVARRTPCTPERGDCVLLLGKHAPRGRIDADFAARLERAATPVARTPSEADVAHRALLARGLQSGPRCNLEARSRDTLQNLRNARDLLDGEMPR